LALHLILAFIVVAPLNVALNLDLEEFFNKQIYRIDFGQGAKKQGKNLKTNNSLNRQLSFKV
jgi:hypothetical protein